MGRPPINGQAMSAAERQRRHRERLQQQRKENFKHWELMPLWMHTANAVEEGLREMAWIIKRHGLDDGAIAELINKFCTIESEAYGVMEPNSLLPDDDDGEECHLPG